MIDDIYNKDVLRLAADISRTDRLATPDATVSLNSPLCGSTITVDIKVRNGKIADYAHDIKACALGQAAASVVAATIIGSDRNALSKVMDQVAAMLAGGGTPPDGAWAALAALAPATAATSRHGAILLPFKAVLQAWDELEAGANKDNSNRHGNAASA